MPALTWLRAVALVAFAGTYLGLAVGHLPGFRVVTLALGWLTLVLLPA